MTLPPDQVSTKKQKEDVMMMKSNSMLNFQNGPKNVEQQTMTTAFNEYSNHKESIPKLTDLKSLSNYNQAVKEADHD